MKTKAGCSVKVHNLDYKHGAVEIQKTTVARDGHTWLRLRTLGDKGINIELSITTSGIPRIMTISDKGKVLEDWKPGPPMKPIP